MSKVNPTPSNPFLSSSALFMVCVFHVRVALFFCLQSYEKFLQSANYFLKKTRFISSVKANWKNHKKAM